ncbi:hypothetical protein SUGI_0756190 [Cryptomeria japonica]|nr:hypothetical protein SUGI_0756190 [Cryptomeria japonica]
MMGLEDMGIQAVTSLAKDSLKTVKITEDIVDLEVETGYNLERNREGSALLCIFPGHLELWKIAAVVAFIVTSLCLQIR